MTSRDARRQPVAFELAAAARATTRRLGARRVPIAALGAITAMASAYAALVIVTWAALLPQAAATDLAAMPDAAITATQGSVSNSTGSGGAGDSTPAGQLSALPRAVRDAVSGGEYSTELITRSDSLSLRSVRGTAPDSFIKAFAASSLARHAVLVAGSWPGPTAQGAAVPVAAPEGVFTALHMSIGSVIALPDAAGNTTIRLRVVGEFRRAGAPASWWAWDDVGTAGFRADGPYTLFAPLAVDDSAFRTGALSVDSRMWLVLATTAAARDPARSAAQAATMATAFSAVSFPRYVVGGSLAADLSALDAREAAAHAELLGTCLLVALVAAAGLVTAASQLTGESAAQDALNRARGASGARLAAGYWPEVGLLALAAAAGAFGAQAGVHRRSAAVWLAAALIAVAAAAVVCVRAARPAPPAQLAVARGRQPALARALRDGADLALLVLAALALWQASGSPLLGTGTDGLLGANPVVAAAPALVVVAVAALVGRLLPAAARRAESGASAARWLPVVFACWQLSRRPLGYALPALICVAAVGGSTFALAEHASGQRSQVDQASYATGAQVRVDTAAPLPLDQVGQVTHAPGVRAATPVVRIAQSQGASLLALDAAAAANTVLLRPDLASQKPDAVWRELGAAPDSATRSVGVTLPGAPVDLALRASLTASPRTLPSATVAATVQDGVGMTYRLDLGSLPADGAQHTLSARLTAAEPPRQTRVAYPIRVLRLDLAYQAPSTASAQADFSVSALAGRGVGAAGATVAGSAAALASWQVTTTWGGGDIHCGASFLGSSLSSTMPYEEPSASTPRVAPGDGTVVDFYTGVGEDWSGQNQCTPIEASLSLSARPARAALPAIATRAYLESTGTAVGATVPITVNGAALSARIVGSVEAFPTLPETGPGALITDLPTLAAAAVARGGAVFPTDEWWLSAAPGTVPAGLPPGSAVTTAAGAAGQLAADPLSRAATTPMLAGAVGLPLLAALCLAASLAAGTGSEQDRILMLLGADGRQRLAIRCLLNSAVAVPAALLGAGLGWVVARLLIPEFVLAADGQPPSPPALIVFLPWEAALAALGLTAVAIAGPFSSALRERRLSAAAKGAEL